MSSVALMCPTAPGTALRAPIMDTVHKVTHLDDFRGQTDCINMCSSWRSDNREWCRPGEGEAYSA